ncbi:MAG: hypothetical protein E6G41_06300 [Actinobacteria bacterium]|nr:MAG: hypothetical protein E6G41_06300 [Actinomycetota bacterium]
MPLLSGMFRSAAIYGSTDTIGGRVVGRQSDAWARRTVDAAMPHRQQARPPAWIEARLQALDDLHRKGVVNDAEYGALRARLGA